MQFFYFSRKAGISIAAKSKLIKVTMVTIIALKTDPRIIPTKAVFLFIDNKKDAKEPVQTPVIGRGIPINNIKPKILYLLIFSNLVLVRFKIGFIISDDKRTIKLNAMLKTMPKKLIFLKNDGANFINIFNSTLFLINIFFEQLNAFVKVFEYSSIYKNIGPKI